MGLCHHLVLKGKKRQCIRECVFMTVLMYNRHFNRWGNVTKFQKVKNFTSCISDKLFNFSVYELLNFVTFGKVIRDIVFCMWQPRHCFWFVTFIRARAHIHTHTYTHSFTHLNFGIFWKDREIRCTGNLILVRKI